MRKKLSALCVKIYGIGCVVVLILSMLCSIAFAISFMTGPERATEILLFLQRFCLPYITLLAVITCAVGITKMYLDREQVFTIRSNDD